jgi:peptidoglycan/xylan/chitin deacetylase (PgdA/CDA1 family)
MRTLQHLRYQPLELGTVVRWLNDGVPLSPRAVLITFDDAYADLATHAFPVLQAHRFPATVFVVSGAIGGTSTWDEGHGDPHALLDADGLRKWSAAGVEIGAHSRSHRDLTTLMPDAAEAEIRGSRQDLEQLLDRPVTAFAYPYGRIGRLARDVVAREFALGFTVAEGRNHQGTDPAQLRRTMVQRHDSAVALVQRLVLGRSITTTSRQALGRLRQRVVSAASTPS